MPGGPGHTRAALFDLKRPVKGSTVQAYLHALRGDYHALGRLGWLENVPA